MAGSGGSKEGVQTAGMEDVRGVHRSKSLMAHCIIALVFQGPCYLITHAEAQTISGSGGSDHSSRARYSYSPNSSAG